MTILYINKNTFPKTLFLSEPIKGSNIRLISLNFTNKVFNLPSIGKISNDKDVVLVTFQPGNWTIESMIKEVNKANKGITIVLVNDKYKILSNLSLHFNDSLAKFFSIQKIYKKPGPALEISFKPLIHEVFLNCDLIDQSNVLYNGSKSQVLACIPLESNRTNYFPNDNLYTRLKSGSYITSLNLWITDCDGNIISTSVYEICLKLEII